MTVLFDIKMEFQCGSVYWFKAKNSYDVRIDTSSGYSSCTCMAGVFKESGGNQSECKHIKRCREFLEAMKK